MRFVIIKVGYAREGGGNLIRYYGYFMTKNVKRLFSMAFFAVLMTTVTQASHISGIRITQTGNTGLQINVDITAFYTTGSTEATANLGTYYNQVPAADWGDGSTIPRYGVGPSTGIPLVATSTVVNGIPARSYRGSFSHTYGAAGNYTIEANTGCCPLTTPTNTLVTGNLLVTTVTTTGPFGPTTFTTSFVQNTLNVNAVAPSFSKAFAPTTVAINTPSTLTFSIDNTASTLDDNVLDFTDNLPAGMVVATPANPVNTCTGGTLTATSGAAVVSYTGGVVAAGTSCAISVDVIVTQVGSFVNTTGDLTSAFGNSGTASDTLVGVAPPAFSKAFVPTSVAINTPSTLTFTIDNSANPVDGMALDFTDNFPVNMVVATPGNAVTTCTGGTLTAVDGTTSLTYTGGTVSTGASCTLSVDVIVSSEGDFVNTTGDLTSDLGNSGTASDTLTAFSAPAFSKVFSPTNVPVNFPSSLTFTVDNTINTVSGTALDFTDNLPAGMEVASPANATTTCTGGTLTAAVGATSVTYTGGTVSAVGSCTVSVDVIVIQEGTFVNTTGDLTSSLGNSGTANDTLTGSSAPMFTKTFTPDIVAVNAPSTLIFTIDNTPNTVAATALDFIDNLPTGMEVASPANVTTTCTGGTITAAVGATSVTYTGGTVNAAASCTVSVDVIVTLAGDFVNTTGDLTSSLGNSGTAGDTLTGASAPIFSKTFTPDNVPVNSPSTLTFTIDNTANTIDANMLDFTDNLPAGMETVGPTSVSLTCTGGNVTASPGATSISYFGGGVVSAGTSCTINVDVIVTQAGTFVNTTGDLTSSLGNSGTASDTLVGSLAPVFSKAFDPSGVAINQPSTLTFTIDNSANAIVAGMLDFTDNLPVGMEVASPANASTTCSGGTITAAVGATSVVYSGGSVNASASCIVVVDVIVTESGDFMNNTEDLTSDLGNSGTANDTLTGFSGPLFTKAFNPSEFNIVDENGQAESTLTFTIDNNANSVDANDLDFVDNMPVGMTVNTPANVVNNCVGGTVNAVSGDGVISYSGGTVLAGSVCTISVDIIVDGIGSFDNDAGILSSSIGSSASGSSIGSIIVGIVRSIPTTSMFGLALLMLLLAYMTFKKVRRKPRS